MHAASLSPAPSLSLLFALLRERKASLLQSDDFLFILNRLGTSKSALGTYPLPLPSRGEIGKKEVEGSGEGNWRGLGDDKERERGEGQFISYSSFLYSIIIIIFFCRTIGKGVG